MKIQRSHFLASAFTFLVMTLINSCTPDNPVLMSIVTFHVGDVQIISSGNPPRPVAIRDVICENDTIITGRDAEAVVQMGDTIVVNILAESRVTFISMMESAKIELKLDNGKLLNKLGKLKGQREFRITTKTSTASVRGTTFLVFADPKTSTVAVGEGTVMVKKTVPVSGQIQQGKEAPAEKEEAEVAVTKNRSVEIAEEVKAPPVTRPITEVETLYIEKIESQPVISKPEKKSAPEIEKIREEIKPEIKQIEKKIETFYPQSLKKISDNYDSIDEVRLYNGKVYYGKIVSRGDQFVTMSTPAGRVQIPINKVKYTGIKK
jgi:hypothetical protein